MLGARVTCNTSRGWANSPEATAEPAEPSEPRGRNRKSVYKVEDKHLGNQAKNVYHILARCSAHSGCFTMDARVWERPRDLVFVRCAVTTGQGSPARWQELGGLRSARALLNSTCLSCTDSKQSLATEAEKKPHQTPAGTHSGPRSWPGPRPRSLAPGEHMGPCSWGTLGCLRSRSSTTMGWSHVRLQLPMV